MTSKYDKLVEVYGTHSAMGAADQYKMNDQKHLMDLAEGLEEVSGNINSGNIAKYDAKFLLIAAQALKRIGSKLAAIL